MKIILKKSYQSLGNPGDVVNVKRKNVLTMNFKFVVLMKVQHYLLLV